MINTLLKPNHVAFGSFVKMYSKQQVEKFATAFDG